MFQNIAQDYDQEEIQDVEFNSNKSKFSNIVKANLNVQTICMCIVSFFASMVSFGDDIAPFGLAIFAAACGNKIPAAFISVATLLGTFIGFGTNAFLMYLLTMLVFIAQIFIFKPKYQEENRNEKYKLGLFVFIANFLVQASKMLFGMFLVYDLLLSIMTSIITYIFYKIFVNSLLVINQFGIKKVFTVEEVIGASLLLSVAVSSFSEVSIFGFSITNIISIMFVLILGWQNGMLVGATTGITIGVVLGIINSSNPILISAYALSGMIAGILNKLGKFGVIIGFIGGNALLAYVVNGNTIPIITIREVLIASLGLLFLPKSMELDIEDLFGKTKLLPVTSDNRLEGEKETIYKLNSMSETISEIARSYDEAAATVEEDIEELKHKNIFKAELLNNIEDYSDNILYDDITDLEDGILDKIYDKLEEQEEITKEDILKVFEESNCYIVGIDDEDIGDKLNKEIQDMTKVINDTYKITRLNLIWDQKMKDSKKSISSQLNGVSQAISSLAENINEKEETKKEPQFIIQVGASRTTKHESEVSGDSTCQAKLHDGKYMLAISDGMGSRKRSKKKQFNSNKNARKTINIRI